MAELAIYDFVTAPTLAAPGVERLERDGSRVLYLGGVRDATEVERVMAATAVDAVISRTIDFTAPAIDACPTLRVVSKHGAGRACARARAHRPVLGDACGCRNTRPAS